MTTDTRPETSTEKRPVARKPTPDEITRLRELFPKGAPRFDYREMALVVERAEASAEADAARATGAAAEPGVIPIAISSEAPVLRYDWWEDQYYYEVLDHSPSSVIMDYCRDGMPFVASHRSRDADSQHGLVKNVRLERKILRGDVKMSRAQRSQEIAQDMVDGIRNKVSVGYIVGDEYDQTEKAKDGIPIRRYTAWMPIETSTVPIPADYSVGVGRAADPEARAAIARFLTLHPAREQTTSDTTAGERSAAATAEGSPRTPTPTPAAARPKERTMEGENAAPGGTATTTVAAPPANAETRTQVTVTATHERDAEVLRIKNIRAWGKEHAIDSEKIQHWVSSGTPQLEASLEIGRILQERMAKPINTVDGPQLSEKDQKRFSFARALMLGTDLVKECRGQPGGSKIDFGLEEELSQEVSRTVAAQNGGRMMAFSLFARMLPGMQARAGVDSATSTTGGPFKFTQPGDFIPVLRNKTSVMRAGATVLSGLTGPLTFPKQTAAASTAYTTENPGSPLSITNLLTTTLTLSFKSLGAATAFSRQVLFSAASGNFDMEAIIQGDVAAVVGLAIDLGALDCADANGPRGLRQNTSIGSVNAGNGTNGGTASWNTYVDLETLIGDANADTDRMAYITNTKQRGVAKKIAVLGNTASGVPVWSGTPGQMDGVVNGYRAIASNQVPRNLTKGSSTTVCSAIFFGAWEHQLIGIFGNGFETIVDPYSAKFKGMVEVAAWVFFDANQRYDGAFSAALDAL